MFYLVPSIGWPKRSYGSSFKSKLFRFKLAATKDHDNGGNDDEEEEAKKRGNARICSRHVLSEMPEYLRFNPWIRTGYRSWNLSTIECLQSIATVHNETINIATHGLAMLYVMLNYGDLFRDVMKLPTYLSYCHMISCLSPWIGSFIYHVFMNHRSGLIVYERLLQGDMAGIWITQTFGALTTLNASFIVYGTMVRQSITAFYLCLSLWALYKALSGRSAWQRALSFTLLVTVRIIAFIVRLSTADYHLDRNHLLHVTMQELLPILGAFLSATRIPERFCPDGWLDLAFNSHNIMHCMVVLGAVHMHFAFLVDIEIVCRVTFNSDNLSHGSSSYL